MALEGRHYPSRCIRLTIPSQGTANSINPYPSRKLCGWVRVKTALVGNVSQWGRDCTCALNEVIEKVLLPSKMDDLRW